MIWLDEYRDDNNSSVGYTVSRQNDKKAVEFDKKTGLRIKDNTPVAKESPTMKNEILSRIFKAKDYYVAQKLNPCKFYESDVEEAYADLEKKAVYFNGQTQSTSDMVQSLTDQVKAMKESLEEASDFPTYDFSWYKRHAEVMIENKYGDYISYKLEKYHKYYSAFEPEYILLFSVVDILEDKYVVITTDTDTLEEFDTMEEAQRYWDDFFTDPDDEDDEATISDTAENWYEQEW